MRDKDVTFSGFTTKNEIIFAEKKKQKRQEIQQIIFDEKIQCIVILFLFFCRHRRIMSRQERCFNSKR